MNHGTIIYIGGFELPDKNAAAHRVLNNAKILRELNFNVVFIDVDKTKAYKDKKNISKRSIQGFDWFSIPYPHSKKEWVNYLSDIKFLYPIFDRISDIKALICYNYQSIAFMKLKLYCEKKNIKVIADCTEWYSTKGSNFIFKIIKGIDSFIRMRVVQKNVDGLIVISSYLDKYYNKSKTKIIIPPLVDLKEDKWIENYRDEGNEKTVNLVYAGSPGKSKDELELIIECLYELKSSNFLFNIIGLTREQYLNNHHNKQKNILDELENKIIFLGRMPHLASLKYVKKADFTIFIRESSRMNNAGFPTKFVESISCGTPVITTKISDLERYIINGSENGFLVDSNNKKDIMIVLQNIFKLNIEEVHSMKNNLVDKNLFHYGNYINQVREFLKELNFN
jgi:glycosyltransferase involved in cell wall biosynthesis